MITLTGDMWKLLQDVNYSVNKEIKYLGDMEHYGKREHWCFPADGLGDCEDYAIAKRARLEDAGIKGYFAFCKTELGGYHAVLLIDTDRGTYVLDNRDDCVWPYDQFNYTWISREMEDGTWCEILV